MSTSTYDINNKQNSFQFFFKIKCNMAKFKSNLIKYIVAQLKCYFYPFNVIFILVKIFLNVYFKRTSQNKKKTKAYVESLFYLTAYGKKERFVYTCKWQ